MRPLTKFLRPKTTLQPTRLLSQAEICQKALEIIRAELQNPPFLPPWPGHDIFIDIARATRQPSDIQKVVEIAEKLISPDDKVELLCCLSELTNERYLDEAIQLVSNNSHLVEKSGHRNMTEGIIRAFCELGKIEKAKGLIQEFRSQSCCRCCETDMRLVIAEFTLQKEDLDLVLAIPEKERWGVGPALTNTGIALLLVRFGKIVEAREIALQMEKEHPAWDYVARIFTAIAGATGRTEDIQRAQSTIGQIAAPIFQIIARVNLAVITGDVMGLNIAWQEAQRVKERPWRSQLLLKIVGATS